MGSRKGFACVSACSVSTLLHDIYKSTLCADLNSRPDPCTKCIPPNLVGIISLVNGQRTTDRGDMHRSSFLLIWLRRSWLFFLFLAPRAWAQAPDTVLINGKILTVDSQFSIREALAVRDGKILALGRTADIRKLAGPRTRVIDLQGRTVIPGLIDSHLHGIRAGLSFTTEVNWVGASSLDEAMGRIRQAARTMKPGAWLIVAGGWNVQQFKEKRLPSQADLIAAAPDNPVYVQQGYGRVVMNPAACAAMHITSEADLPAGGRFEKDADGKPNGAIVGSQNAIIALFDKLPKPSMEEQIDGTKQFFRELNRLGITGFVDPGGNNVSSSRLRRYLQSLARRTNDRPCRITL